MLEAAFSSDDLLAHSLPAGNERGVSLLALAAAFIQEWRTGLITFVVVTALGAAIIFAIKPKYVATSTILPQQKQQSDDFASLFSGHGPGVVYLGLLKSNSVANVVIDHLNLLSALDVHSYEAARSQLAGMSTFEQNSDGIITISVRDRRADRASAIANAYTDALQLLDERMNGARETEAKNIFQSQLDEELDELAKAEQRLVVTQRKTGLIQPEVQTTTGLGAIESTRQQIMSLDVQLAGLTQSMTENNPQVQRVRSQIQALRKQEAILEKGGPTPLGAAPSAADIPSENVEYARAERDVHYHAALVESLSSQYETARLNEDVGRMEFQVVDRAVVPEHKAWPPRRPFLILDFFLGFLGGVSAVCLKIFGQRILDDPEQRDDLNELRTALHLKPYA